MQASKSLAFTVLPAPAPPPPPAPAGVVPAFPVSTSHPDWATWKPVSTPDGSNRAVSYGYLYYVLQLAHLGTSSFGYGIHHLALAYKSLDPNGVCYMYSSTAPNYIAVPVSEIRDRCVALFRSKLSAALTKWNAQQNLTEFSNDSYLYCGDTISDWVYVLNWFRDQLTDQEIADAEMILNQAVWNVWNYTQAKWNGKLYAWSGWASTNGGDPNNNYFIRSHWRGLLFWAIHSRRPEWLQKLSDLLPRIRAAYAKLVGGGWLEGTGYGTAMWNLFMDVWLSRESLGVDLTADARVAEHLDYWLWANTPDFKSYAPIGDAPTGVSDTFRAILTWGALLVPGSPQAERVRWWMQKNGVKASRPENLWMTCYDVMNGPASAPVGNYYFAPGVGHLFAKAPDGSMLCVQAGPYNQSHDHKDQGEFQIYRAGKWACVTANVPSSSDIIQSSQYHNCILFRDAAGKVVEPEWLDPTPPEMVVNDDGTDLAITINGKKAFDNCPDILSYTRTIHWRISGGDVHVEDAFAVQNGFSGSWRATFADQPLAREDGSYLAGGFTIHSSVPPLAPVDWKIEAPATFNQDYWRFEAVGSTSYAVEISW